MNKVATSTDINLDIEVLTMLQQTEAYALIVIGSHGNILKWNWGAEVLFAKKEAEMLHEHFSILYSKFLQPGLTAQQIIKNVAVHGRFAFDAVHLHENNKVLYVNTIISKIVDVSERNMCYLLICRDITHEKKLETENKLLREGLEEKVKQRTQQLSVVNGELEAFSYSVSHDLRTPLRAISGFAEILLEDYAAELDDEGRRVINIIVRNAKMMGRLIDDLLTFSKMSRLTVEDQSVNMNQLVERCFDVHFLVYDKKNYNVTIHPLHNCGGDASMLNQVWANLIGNALKYSSQTTMPTIEVGCTVTALQVTYYIKDNGVGFDMEYAHKLFGVFQRLHRQDEFEGTGLGLALVKRIISKHGGEIWAEASIDAGATFYFNLPIKNIDNPPKISHDEH